MRALLKALLLPGLACLLLTSAIEAAPSRAGVPEWISKDKIRAMYMSQWDSADLPQKVSEAGFNTLFIAFCNGADHYDKWAALAKQNNLHFFATIWFDYLAYAEAIHGPGGAGPKAMSTYRAFVQRDTGPHTAILCPADSKYWSEWIAPSFLEMAKLSAKDKALDGIILDAELYGPLTTKPAIPVSFYMDVGPCMCDDCFADFLKHTPEGKGVADIRWQDRYAWVEKHKLGLQYNLRLRDRVAEQARQLEKQVHAINPDLLLGLMNWYKNDIGPGPNENYFLHGLLVGLKTPKRPAVVWTESPEYEMGYGPHTDARREHFECVGDVVYVPGLYLEQHPPAKLAQQVNDLATHSDGYWIFTRSQDLQVNPTILASFKAGNDKIAAAAPPESEAVFADLWKDYDQILDITRNWRFRTDPDNVGGKNQWFKPGLDLGEWRPIDVNKFWDEQLGTQYVARAWYRVVVDVPASAKGRKLFLAFGAVDEEAQVWVNGKPAGRHGKGQALWDKRFLIPVDKLITPGKFNTITVRVYNSVLAGGIWRPVRLMARKAK